MSFEITDVVPFPFPNSTVLDDALGRVGLTQARLLQHLEGWVCHAPPDDRGYQQILAREMEVHLARALTAEPQLVAKPLKYSPKLGERADVAVGTRDSDAAVFIEIEFRPNVGKDLVKFQIGHNSGRLAAGVLILAFDRREINPRYTSMPEFVKWLQVIAEYRPRFPILLVGIKGRFRAPSPNA